MSKLEGVYDSIISLGCCCEVAFQQRENLLRDFSGPFDWIISNDLLQVIKQLQNEFCDFIRMQDMLLINSTYDFPRAHEDIVNKENGFAFPHDFVKSISIDEQYEVVLDKYSRRIAAFYNKSQSGHKLLFIRKLSEFENIENTRKLTICLKNFLNLKDFKLCIVDCKKSDKITECQIDENTFLVKMPQDNDALFGVPNKTFLGNYKSWRHFCREIYLKSKIYDKKNMQVNHEKLVDFVQSLAAKKVVFYGAGDGASGIYSILNEYLDIYISDILVADSKEDILYDNGIQRLSKEELLKSPEKFFVIITPRLYYKEIVEELEANNFIKNKDYVYFYHMN